MKFVSTRELRNHPTGFRETVEQDDVVLTVNGKPFAVVLGVDEGELEETLGLLHQLRARRAMAQMQRRAAERALSGLSMEEIDQEIHKAREERGRGR